MLPQAPFSRRWRKNFPQLILSAALVAGAAIFIASAGNSVQPASAMAPRTTPIVLHLHGNLHDGCTGDGRTDLVACNGPFLLTSAALDSSPAASWSVPNPATNGTTDRNIHDPNWIWNLTTQTTLVGLVTVDWWASCGACGG